MIAYLLGDGVLDDEDVAGDGVDDLAGGRLRVEDGDVLVQHRAQVRQPHLRRLPLARVHPASHLCHKLRVNNLADRDHTV
jgi:hypothetical protein